VDGFGGWGRGTQRAFGAWYAAKDPKALAYQAVKYQRRNGWSNRDLLRKAHVKPPTAEHDAIFRWMVAGWDEASPQAPQDGTRLIWAFERAKRASDRDEIVRLIQEYGLTREGVPTTYLKDAHVWDALLDNAGRGMPMTAMIRNLGKMTDVGLLKPMSNASRFVVNRLRNQEALRKARIHPLAALVALNTYQSGRGVRGSLQWTPVQPIVDALDHAFYATFKNQTPTGLRWMLGLDVSGSMGWGHIAGLPGITPRVAAAAMAMVTARVEANHALMAFTGEFIPLNISPRERLDAVMRKTSGLNFGPTDCALPMLHALKHRIPVDVFAIYTDNETWYGKVHPAQALAKYRQTMGIPAKLIVVGMVGNEFSIANPDDAGMLDVVGFDTAAPAVMRDFALS
jgi:60 kDa SS-A/Ro ribonucleoprotein